MKNNGGPSALSTICLSSVSVLCPSADAVGVPDGMRGGASTCGGEGSDSVSGACREGVALKEPKMTGGMGETMIAFEAKAPCTGGESRDMADDATVFAAPVDGGARRGAGEAAAES